MGFLKFAKFRRDCNTDQESASRVYNIKLASQLAAKVYSAERLGIAL